MGSDGRPWFKKKRWWAVGVLAFLGIAGALGNDDEPTVTTSAPTETSVTSAAQPTTIESTTPPETPASEPPVETTTAEPEPEPEPAEPELSVSQQQAIRSAEDYLDFSAFSRSGLINQLEFEGFSTEDATFAVDNITVDWNEQAAKSAEQYLEFTSFSRSGLINQLEFEGFTSEQATYGADAVGL